MENKFCKRLNELREEKKFSMEELAKKVETTRMSIWRYENGEADPPSEILVKLADIFSVSTDYLLGRADYDN